jgi:hypothetical protein
MNKQDLNKITVKDQQLKLILPLSYWNKTHRVIELNEEWVDRVIDNRWVHDKWRDNNLTDILHDVNGILQEDEHFLTRL